MNPEQLQQWLALSNAGLQIVMNLFLHFKSEGKTDAEALDLITARALSAVEKADELLALGHEKDVPPVLG